ncbi:MAG TPA: cytochrome c, partial [Flavisolibacter sp.]
MILIRPLAQKLVLLGFLLLSIHSLYAQGGGEGKQLFQQNCQTCHALDKKLTGPPLRGFTERGPWTDKNNIYAWVKNPAAFMQKDAYTQALKAEYGVIMQAFPNLSNEQIDAIVDYVATAPTNNAQTTPGPGDENPNSEANQ